jgi:hypothetical protein
VTQPTQTEYHEKPETDPQQRVEKRLHADAIDDVNEQTETKQKRERLQPNEIAARIVLRGFRFFGEFFSFAVLPAICELFSRFNQGDTVAPLAVAFDLS